MCPREPLPLEGARGAARRGWLPLLATKPPPLCLPPWGRGTASAVDRVLSQTAHLRCISPALFHTARTLSGSLRSPPSPRGEGCVSGIPLSPSNLRPFGDLLPEEGGSDRESPFPWKGRGAQRGGVGFLFAAEPPPLCLPHRGRGTAPAVDRVLS